LTTGISWEIHRISWLTETHFPVAARGGSAIMTTQSPAGSKSQGRSSWGGRSHALMLGIAEKNGKSLVDSMLLI